MREKDEQRLEAKVKMADMEQRLTSSIEHVTQLNKRVCELIFKRSEVRWIVIKKAKNAFFGCEHLCLTSTFISKI